MQAFASMRCINQNCNGHHFTKYVLAPNSYHIHSITYMITFRYLPIGGLKEFNNVSVKLAYGDDSPAIQDARVAAVQTLSGTGSCRLMAEFMQRWMQGSKVLRSHTPKVVHWVLHVSLLGFIVTNSGCALVFARIPCCFYVCKLRLCTGFGTYPCLVSRIQT